MSGMSMCQVVGVGRGVGGYQPGVYMPLKALFVVLGKSPDMTIVVDWDVKHHFKQTNFLCSHLK